MTHCLRRWALGFSLAAVAALYVSPARGGAAGPAPQQTTPDTGERKGGVRFPNGKLQADEILKSEREQNIKDAARLAELVLQLQQELEKNDYTVLSMSTLKKTEDIEKLARKIHNRMQHN